MPEFLTTIKTSAAIEDIIKHAKTRIVLISPYLKFSKQLVLRLKDAAQKNVPITVVYGKKEIKPEELEQLTAIKGLKLLFLQDLHAKCYFNEQSLIITSMNIYEFSEKNNQEMGVLFSISEDKKIYDEAVLEAASFVRHAVEVNSDKLGNKEITDNKITFDDKKNLSSQQKNDKKNRHDESRSFFKINPKYKSQSNFHFPGLFDCLSSEYPKTKKSLNVVDNEAGFLLTAEDFPIRDVDLIIGDSIKFDFINRDHYKRIKSQLKETFEDRVPSASFYWNYGDLNIVPANKENFAVSEDGLRQKIGHYLEIIRIVSTAFRKAKG